MANTENPKPKRSLGCCLLKIFLLLFIVGMLGLGAVGLVVYRTVGWFKNAAEPAPATFPALKISEGEEQDVNRIIMELSNGKKDKTLIDETVTPTVFNGIIERIISTEKARGKTPGLEGLRGGFDGEHFSVDFSAPEKNQLNPDGTHKFINGKVTFDLEVEEGIVKEAHVHNLMAGGREAPSTVKWFLNSFFVHKLKNPDNAESRKAVQGFKAFKLLKREGERLHVILDPVYFKDENGGADAPAPPAPAPGEKGPEKTTF